MRIFVKKIGTTLSSRESGKEALLAFGPNLNGLAPDEIIEIDFEGVVVMGPSWADEFITPLKEKYKNRVVVENVGNPSIQATLDFLGGLSKS